MGCGSSAPQPSVVEAESWQRIEEPRATDIDDQKVVNTLRFRGLQGAWTEEAPNSLQVANFPARLEGEDSYSTEIAAKVRYPTTPRYSKRRDQRSDLVHDSFNSQHASPRKCSPEAILNFQLSPMNTDTSHRDLNTPAGIRTQRSNQSFTDPCTTSVPSSPFPNLRVHTRSRTPSQPPSLEASLCQEAWREEHGEDPGAFVEHWRASADVTTWQDPNVVGRIEYRIADEMQLQYEEEADCRSASLLSEGSFEELYKVENMIAVGSRSHVCRAFERASGAELAVKVLDCRDKTQMEWVAEELALWKQLKHPYIVQLHDYALGEPVSHMCMELLAGGSLVAEVMRAAAAPAEGYSEDDVRCCVARILHALQAMHAQHIAHVDIKLDNLLLSEANDITTVKLADFGSSLKMDGTVPGRCYGTPSYMAPEMILHNHLGVYGDLDPHQPGPGISTAVDVWSLGVVLFTLLGKYMPFACAPDQDLYQLILRGNADPYTGSAWGSVSEGAKDLIERMLQLDPERRITVAEALEHPWILGTA